MMRDGECWEQSTPALRTSETESGLSQVPTPRVTNHQKNSRDKYVSLGAWVKLWPTPKANEPGMTAKTTGRGVEKSTHLTTQVALAEGMIDRKTGRLWPTPTVQDSKNNGAQSQMERNTKPLNAEVGGALNPTWVEWLMGWPLGWTDSAQSATDKFRQWLRSHSNS
jgi:hypothetical protein